MSVKAGQVYKHFKGNLYVILAVSEDCEDWGTDHIVVTYMNLESGRVWHRKLKEFISPKVTEIGEKIVRFTLKGKARVTINDMGHYEVTRVYFMGDKRMM